MFDLVITCVVEVLVLLCLTTCHFSRSSVSQVIFSQSSDLMERQSSMASSTEEVSGPDLSAGSQNPDHFGVFKDFDFLEYESESVEVKSKTTIYIIILS